MLVTVREDLDRAQTDRRAVTALEYALDRRRHRCHHPGWRLSDAGRRYVGQVQRHRRQSLHWPGSPNSDPPVERGGRPCRRAWCLCAAFLSVRTRNSRHVVDRLLAFTCHFAACQCDTWPLAALHDIAARTVPNWMAAAALACLGLLSQLLHGRPMVGFAARQRPDRLPSRHLLLAGAAAGWAGVT